MRMESYSFDVIVAGGGPTGLCAAVAAARNGAKTLLVERYGFLGGNATVSLVGPWMTFHAGPNEQIVEGMPEELVRRLQKADGSLGHVRDTTGYVSTVTPFDAEVLKMVAFEMCEEAGVTLLLHTVVTDVIRDGNRVTGLVVYNKSGYMELRAPVVIDTTGDGDVAVLAGAEFQQGRESDGLTQPMTMMFRMAGVDLAAVRAHMAAHPDNFYRRTMLGELEQQPHLSVNGFYREFAAAQAAGEVTINRDMVLFFQTVRADEVTVNMTRVQGLSATNAWELTKAEVELRRQVWQLVAFFRKYIPGFQNAYLAATGTQAGVRESRRIMGDHVLTADEISEGTHFADIISRYAYPIDIHSPDGKGTKTVRLKTGSYEIPYRVLLPRGIEGLLVAGRCLSCTHEALAAVRTMPSMMAVGQAAGTAAALAVQGGVTPRQVEISALHRVLAAQGANLLHAAVASHDGEEEPSGDAAAGS
jgi:ribulose 1,5-bisphosphate synthetase/thiazole synthase